MPRFAVRAAVGFGLVVSLLIATAAVALTITGSILDRHRALHDAHVADLRATHAVQLQAERMVAARRGYLLMGEPGLLDEARTAGRALDEALAAIEDRPGSSGEAQAVRDAARRYRRSLGELEHALSRGDRAVVEQSIRTLFARRQRLDEAVARLTLVERAAIDRSARHARSAGRTAMAAIAALSSLAVVLATALALAFHRQLLSLYRRESSAREHANRETDARKELLGIVAHDLRTPLTSIALNAEVLAKSAEDGSNERRRAEAVRNAALDMERLIQDLVDAVRAEAGALSPQRRRTSVRALTARMFDLFAEVARRASVMIEAKVEHEGALEVDCDPELVLRALGNIVSNAVKFTPAGGRIGVRAFAAGERVHFEVRDTGPGIPASEQARVFDRFWTSEAQSRGTGLGLYIARAIVEAHGGRIGLRSLPGAGTTFFFDVPRAPPLTHAGDAVHASI